MQSGVRDLTRGRPSSVILGFALPVFISQVFQQLYNTADAFIVGKKLGTEALAAVSSSGTLIFLMISFFEGLSMGAGIAISRYFGAGDEKSVSKAIHTDIAVGLVCGGILTVVGMVFTPTFLTWMNTDPDVMPLAVEYFRYYFAGVISLVMYNMMRGIMNALGDSRRPLIYLIISSMTNIVLDALFVYVLELGVRSAAVATVISQSVSAILCLIHLMKKGNVYTIEFKKLRFHADMFREMIRFGMPSGIQNSVIGFANVIVQTQINSFGKYASAAYGTHAKIEGFGFLPITSFAMAIATFISQNLGARQYERAKKGARFGIITGVLLAETIGTAVFILAPKLIAIFDDTPEVVRLGTMQARTVALFYFLLAYSHLIAAVCRGAGKAIVPMTVMLSVWCLLRIVYIIIIMNTVGEIRYIYLAYPITWAITSVIYFIYYHVSDWVHGFERAKKAG